MLILTNSNSRRLSFVSKYNVKLYKKCLSLKLVLTKKDGFNDLPNISFDNKKKKFFFKRIYLRRERIPLRLLRLFSFMRDNIDLIGLGSNFILAQKLSVYNGKELKFINTNQGILETTVRCRYTFGDLIFTRARFQFKKKKLKNKKKKINGTSYKSNITPS